MYLITPLRLTFRYGASRHLGELKERLVDGVFKDCTGTFPAKITTNAEQGLREIRRNVRRHLNLCWFVSDAPAHAKLEDFDLVYSCSQTNKQGEVWIRDGERTSNMKPVNTELFMDEVRWLVANLDTRDVTKVRAREATSQVRQLAKKFGVDLEGSSIEVTVLPDKSGYDVELKFPATVNIG